MRYPNKALSLTLLLSFCLFACSHKPARESRPIVGPPAPPTTEPPPKPVVDQPPAPKPIERVRVTLVLGGAGVASFATVGLLKRFQEEGIVIDGIIATGWPALFALGYGFLKSVHDLEWFAMRLAEKDFYKAGLFDLDKEYQGHENLTALIQNAFKQRDLGEAKVPVIISATNTELGEPEAYDRGDWREPLLKTMSVPGLYRPYPQEGGKQWVQSLQGLDVDEAIRRGAKNVIAVQMYDDYLNHARNSGGKKDSTDKVFRQLYLAQMKKTLRREMKLAPFTGEIALHKAPNDFAAKRAAILAGYREAGRLAKELIGRMTP